MFTFTPQHVELVFTEFVLKKSLFMLILFYIVGSIFSFCLSFCCWEDELLSGFC